MRLVAEIRDDHDSEWPAMAKVSEVLEVGARGPVPASLTNACCATSLSIVWAPPSLRRKEGGYGATGTGSWGRRRSLQREVLAWQNHSG